jgi:hypothetical protein
MAGNNAMKIREVKWNSPLWDEQMSSTRHGMSASNFPSRWTTKPDDPRNSRDSGTGDKHVQDCGANQVKLVWEKSEADSLVSD